VRFPCPQSSMCPRARVPFHAHVNVSAH
jgi:hypothetical protein